jgi:predicted Zn-dependent protease
MIPSLVEKYEQILAADPRSRIFVELAKALVEHGDHARAADVCRQGLEHHPSSILGRVIWGRALLESGDAAGALVQFDAAVQVDPSSPYAVNLVGEALVHKQLWREAAPFLARAVALQPSDARLRGWLEEADRRAPGARGFEASIPSAGATPPGTPATGTQPRVVSSQPRVGPATASSAPPPTTSAAAKPPPRPPPIRAAAQAPPPIRRGGNGAPDRSVLSMIPGGGREDTPHRAFPRPATPLPDAEEAARLAAQYEHELREKLLSVPAPAPGFLRRHHRAVVFAALLLAAGGAAGVYAFLRARSRSDLAARAVEAARAGIARDTLSSLQKAQQLLAEARSVRPEDLQLASLAAEVSALLAADHRDADARAVAEDLRDPAVASEGALVARLLLASRPAQRRDAEAAVLSADGASSPLLQALAGEVLLARGDEKRGRARLEAAARATPPLLRALADLGDAEARSGEPEGALAYYTAAIAAQPTHPRSVIGAAESRLALGRDLETARSQLAAVEADPGSAPPAAEALRFELAYARVLGAQGDPAAAAQRLAQAGERLGRSARLDGTLAEIHLAARAYDRAEPAAERAAEREPAQAEWKVLLARARNGRGRYAEALQATAGAEGRDVRVQRAVARYGLGQYAQAKSELERLARDGKMPAEAAVWHGLCDVALGRAAKARPMLEKLASGRTASPLAIVALGRAQEAQGDATGAEETYRAAVARDARAPEGHAALGRFLLARGRAKEAVPPLAQAVKIDPFLYDARRALAEAHLASGDAAAARAALDMLLLARPRDAAALRTLSAAWLAERQPAEARQAAERAVALDRSAASHLALARAALAAGDAAAARRSADLALRAARQGPEADEAKRLASLAAKKG